MANDRQPGRLLVVDDNRVNRLLLAHGLEQDGHKVNSGGEWPAGHGDAARRSL